MSNGLKLVECEKEFAPLVETTKISLSATVYEEGGTPPTTIIHEDQAWYAEVEWEMTGDLVRHFCGKWRVSINLESIGPFPEYAFPTPPAEVDMDPCGDGKYKKTDGIKNAFHRLNQTTDINKPLKSLKKTSATLIRGNQKYASLESLFLGHAPQSMADKHYAAAPQELLDEAITWLGEQYGL